jgi:8-amino-3,8-dideoxy-alpha-D-manno-octulosonate transaminase
MPGYEWMGESEKEQVMEVMESGILFRYEFDNERKGVYKVREFEEKFAQYCGSVYAHAVTSGTAALKVALAALGVGPGDEVITQGFTFIATFEAILEIGAIPVPGEIDDTLNLDPEDFEKKITERTKAVIPVHMLGSPARIEEIIRVAGKRGVRILEDTAQALGAGVGGKKTGSWGDMGTFSFDFYKTLTTGEGGMIITNDRELYQRASEYADHGHDHDPNLGRAMEGRNFLGMNYRMNELQGAIGIAQLGKIDDMIDRQRRNQSLIREALESMEGVGMRALPENGKDSHTHVCFFLPDASKAKSFHSKMVERKVPCVYFRNNLWHFWPNWEHMIQRKTIWPGDYPFIRAIYDGDIEYRAEMLPKSMAIMDRLLVIPISLQMEEEQTQKIAMELQSIAEETL